jgi:hypothetical protein
LIDHQSFIKIKQMKRFLILGLILTWSIILIWPLVIHPDQAPGPRGFETTDFELIHWPTIQYIHDNLMRNGQIPLWDASRLSGQPTSTYLSVFWYLPQWLTILQPLTWMFTLSLLLHLVWCGFGFFRLMHKEGVQFWGMALATLAWIGTPKLIGYIGDGQMNMVYALAWTPWLLLAFRKAAEKPGWQTGALAGVVLAVTFSADIQWFIYASIFGFVYGLAHLRFARQQVKNVVLAIATLALVFLILTAGGTLPLFDFIGYSRRAGLNLQEAGAYAIEPLGLLGMLFPQYGLLYELVVYVGIGPLVLAIAGMARRKWFWFGTALVAILFALGKNSFLYPLLNPIFPFSWLRVPSRAWFIVAFCTAVLAGWGLDGILSSVKMSRIPRWAAPAMAAIVIVISLANIKWYDTSQLTSYALSDSPVRDWLEAQPGLFRVYSPDASIPLPNRLQTAQGYNPLHLASYASFLGKAANMDLPGYSVAVPNIYIDANTPPEIVAAAERPDASQLGLLNVKFLVSTIPLEADGIQLVKTFGEVKIYENRLVKPRAWLEGGEAEITFWSPDRIELESQGTAGRLVLSEIMYPGWQAWVDGNPVPVETYDGILRSVNLSSGTHKIVFEFHPLSVYIGTAIAGVGWVGVIVALAFPFIKRKLNRSAIGQAH